MRRAVAHEYKLLEGVLGWYFGPSISLSYHYKPELQDKQLPVVLIDGVVFAEGRIPVNEVADYIESTGVTRLDGR
ncbi:MAG: hypothetical protein U1D96_05645 [Eubacteriales bacterium]|nr:hypothetical protein [Bacillota bacterium]MBV1726751.1 hypothetical protein [Desulforudis sp.]MDQ7789418.1 hypothetical protein [Clostridia bacterium]MDZ4042964.1 hypothetical protein [Eubacteriales bacterium]MBU4554518.1 hypothetical protein [Bacillota bacterium]